MAQTARHNETIFSYTDYRAFMLAHIQNKLASGRKFSVRSWCKSMNLKSPATLSMILKGHRHPGQEVLNKICQYFCFSPEESVFFEQLVMCSRADSNPQLKEERVEKLQKLKQFHSQNRPTPSYEVLLNSHHLCLSDIRHSLLFELVKVKSFQPEGKWIAQKLGCSEPEAAQIAGRLFQLGLLTLGQDGSWQHAKGLSVTFWPNEKLTSEAHRAGQEEILKLALNALKNVPVENRDQSSMTMATSAAKIAEAKKMITQFRRQLCAFLEDTEHKDSVYQLSLSLFPLISQNEENL